jgi:EPS-associated MarR family transcriptional regulator
VTSEEEAHFRVLKAIEANPDITQRELAEALGLSLGKTNFLVNALLEKGAIKMENFRRSDTKLKKIAYLLTPAGINERLRLTQGYLDRKRREYETLKAEIDLLERDAAHSRAGAVRKAIRVTQLGLSANCSLHHCPKNPILPAPTFANPNSTKS